MVIIHRLLKQKMQQLRYSVWLLSAVLILILVSSESKQQSLFHRKTNLRTLLKTIQSSLWKEDISCQHPSPMNLSQTTPALDL